MKHGTSSRKTTLENFAKIFAFAALVLVTSFLHAQIPKNKNKVDKKGLRQGAWTITYDSKWVETSLKDSISFYRIITYNDDEPQGITTDYYLNGNKQFEGYLISDRPEEIIEGKAFWYYENGTISRMSHFSNGKQNGSQINYYDNGTPYAEVNYENGLVSGSVYYYTEEGELDNIEYYENGEALVLQALWNKAVGLFSAEDFVEAEKLLSVLNYLFTKEYGQHGENIEFILDFLWKSQMKSGKIDEGIKHANELQQVRGLRQIPQDTTYRDWLFEMVFYFQKAERYDQLESLLIKILTIQKKISDKPDDSFLAYARTLGDFYRFQNRKEDAANRYAENIRLVQLHFPNRPDLYSYDLSQLGFILEQQQEYAKAEKIYLEAISAYRSLGDTTENFAVTMDRLIDLYFPQAKSNEALPIARELAAFQKNKRGKYSHEYMNALYSLSKSQRGVLKFEEADSTLKEIREISLKLYGADSREYANFLYHYGSLQMENQNADQAEICYKKSIDILTKLSETPNEKDIIRKAEILSFLGELYSRQKEIVKTQLVLNEAFETIHKIQNQNNFSIAVIYEKIGSANLKIENYDEAEACHKTASEIVKNIYGDTHHNYYQSIANLCFIYISSGREALAIELLDKMLSKAQNENGKDNAAYIALLKSKATAHRNLRQDSVFASVTNEIAQYYKRNFGEYHPAYFAALATLTLAQISYSIEEAEQNILQLEGIAAKNKIKKTDLLYQSILTLKFSLANKKEDYKEQLEVAKIMASITELKGDPSGNINLGLSYFLNNQPKETMVAYQKYIDKVMDDVRQTFPYLTEDQKVGFYNSELRHHLELYYFFALSEPLQIKMNRDSLEKIEYKEWLKNVKYVKHLNVERIFQYQLLTKGILFESSQKMRQSILQSNDPQLIELFNNWQEKKNELNAVFLQPDSKEKTAAKNILTDEIKILERQLTLKSSDFNQADQSEISWRDIQKKLNPGEALVEILPVSAGMKLDPKKNKYSDMYLAFIITHKTTDYPLCVLINQGDELESQSLKNYQNSIRYEIADRKSYDTYWKVIADTLKGIKKIYFAPDGVYHKVNVNTLQNPVTGKFVLEETEIQFISQARDFIQQNQRTQRPPNDIVLFGAPNFNSQPKEPSQSYEQNVKLKIDTTQRFFNGSAISELPGTKVEVQNITSLATKSNMRIQTYTGDEANEAALKAINSPSILHIATHGFFMPELSSSKDEQGRNAGFANFLKEDLKNPLRRSGLLLSYCREAFREEKSELQLSEDGILTADEAQRLNLENTEIVVLSACETGLGEVKNGEGVYGLQRSFQTAGAKSVLMSLWTVSDEATQELMTSFYSQWFKLKDKREAFRQAQLALKEKYTSPYYWGAFVLIGE